MSGIKLFEKQIDIFVKANGLKSADAILVKKQPYKLLDHYIIYLGICRMRHLFMANTLNGIKIYNYDELMLELQTFQPEKIEKFLGTEKDRAMAVDRALLRQDEKSYHLILNNCEHLKNWIQRGIHRSNQVTTAGKIALGGGAVLVATSKSDGGKIFGLLLMALGGFAWAFGDDIKNMPVPKYSPNGPKYKRLK